MVKASVSKRVSGWVGYGTTLGFLAVSAGCAAGCCKTTENTTPAPTAEPRAAEPPKKAEPPSAASTAAPVPAPSPAPATAGDSNKLAADGLPETIPPPSSKVPTTAEWEAITDEVTVKGSSAANCETKMVREWLRVSCRKKGPLAPLYVRIEQKSGQQAYKFETQGQLASVVVQVVKGKEFQATYAFDRGGAHFGKTLKVSWPNGQPRPRMTLE